MIYRRAVIDIGVDEEDREDTWLEDAESVRKIILKSSIDR